MLYPVAGYTVTRGSEAHVADGQRAAVDIAVGGRTDVQALAAWSGVVTYAGPLADDCGNHVQIDGDYYGHAFRLGYCHLAEIWVATGQAVTAGSPIGIVGDTGLERSLVPGAGGVHAHVWLELDGVRVRLEDYLGQKSPITPAPAPEPNPAPSALGLPGLLIGGALVIAAGLLLLGRGD